MSIATRPSLPVDDPPVASSPSRRLMVGLAIAFAVLLAGGILTSGDNLSTDLTGAQIIAKYDHSEAAAQLSAYALVTIAALLIFIGAMIRSCIARRRRLWVADVALGGIVVLAVTLAGWAVTGLAMYRAVHTGNPDVAQTINVLDNENFIPLMLGLICTMVGVGLAGLFYSALPKWLAIVSILLGVIAPIGPAGFIPATLFPIWLIVITAMIRPAE